MSTARAILTGVRRIHSDLSPTGPCCLVGEEGCELRPRRISDALGETMVVHHAVDQQIFHRDQVKRVHEAPAVLVREVAPSPCDTLMHARYDLAPCRPF